MASYDGDRVSLRRKPCAANCRRIRSCKDTKVLAFLDIMPRAPGHALVIPKAAARTIFDVAPDDLMHVIRATQRIARAAMTVFSADGMTIHQFNELAGGQVVFHLHFHVVPRKAACR